MLLLLQSFELRLEQRQGLALFYLARFDVLMIVQANDLLTSSLYHLLLVQLDFDAIYYPMLLLIAFSQLRNMRSVDAQLLL